jgi:hypothetical protein
MVMCCTARGQVAQLLFLKGLVWKQDWKQQDALDMQKAWRQEYVEEERKD